MVVIHESCLHMRNAPQPGTADPCHASGGHIRCAGRPRGPCGHSPLECWVDSSKYVPSHEPRKRPCRLCPCPPEHARHGAGRDPAARTAQGTHPDPGRCHGHHDPAVQAGRGRLPRRALPRPCPRREGQQRAALAHPARHHPGNPREVPGGGGRPHRDQHLRRHGRCPGRLPPAGTGLRDERRLGTAGPGRGRQVQHARTSPLRGRRPGPPAQDRLHLAGRERPGRAQHHLRGAACRLPGTGPWPGRRRSRRVPGRDHLRHPQRQGRAVRAR